MTCSVFVASKGRANNLLVLKDNGILSAFPKEDIFLFVEPQDYKEYNDLWGKRATVVNIRANDEGLGYVRWYMQEWAEARNFGAIWYVDDDIKSIYKRTSKNEKGYWKMEKLPPEDIEEALDDLAGLMFCKRWCQIGLSFKGSNHLEDGSYTEYSRNCAVVCNNIFMLKRHKLYYDAHQVFYNDYLFTCDMIKAGLRSGRSYMYAFDTALMNASSGGCKLLRTDESTRKACERIMQKYGSDFVRMFFHEKHGVYEVKIKWKALRRLASSPASVKGWW